MIQRIIIVLLIIILNLMIISAKEPVKNKKPAENNSEMTNEKNDSTDFSEETFWSYSGYLMAENKAVKQGFTTNNGKPQVEIGSDLSYKDISFSASLDKQLNANIWTYYSFELDYSHSFTDWFDLSLGVSHFKFMNDTLNPNSENTNSINIITTFSYSDFEFDFEIERFFGIYPVNYLSWTLTYEKEFGDFQVDAIADISNSGYTKAIKEKLKTLKKNR